MNPERKRHYDRFLGYNPGVVSISAREIEYRETKPKEIEIQIPLWEYFERIKRFKTDRFQKDLCERLQNALATRHIAAVRAIIHAEAQLGKTSVISQALPAYAFGHDPLFRYALGMYNETRSEEHSHTVIDILNSNIHKDIFPKKDGWLEKVKPAVGGWMTAARRELNDGQYSFNPVGLQSGLTGSGFDWLSIDDPYKNEKEAFSSTVRKNMENFWNYTVTSRLAPHSIVTGMFHRYAPEDFGGFLLNTGDFDYWRYCSQFDGDYIMDDGRIFKDPLNRSVGEYISPDRRPPSYYKPAKKQKRVWLSMFQGRPSSEAGDFFNVGKIKIISRAEGRDRERECVAIVRSYDNAATKDAGAYSAGSKVGILPSGKVVVFNIWYKQVDTAGRIEAQQTIAKDDGAHVTITIPNDPGAAGNDTVFFTKRELAGFTVIDVPTSGSKPERARPFSTKVNAGNEKYGDVEFVDDSDLEEADRWIKTAKLQMRDFPLSDLKDIVDSLADAFNYLYAIYRKGLILKEFLESRHLLERELFVEKFPFKLGGEQVFRIPRKWAVYAAIKINDEASKPTSAVIVARSSANSFLPEHLFVIGEYKTYDSDFYKVFDWIDAELKAKCEAANRRNTTIWLHPKSKKHFDTIAKKLDYKIGVFAGDHFAGLTELNWYLKEKPEAHPFYYGEKAANISFIVDRDEITAADGPDSDGLYWCRQEARTWGFNDKGEPTGVGGVLDCLRMITYYFRTYSEPLTQREKIDLLLDEENKPKPGEIITPEKEMSIREARQVAAFRLAQEEGEIPSDEDLQSIQMLMHIHGISFERAREMLEDMKEQQRDVEW